ncbi:hypothetical protein Glove_271g3 [Diversispora epigaea]|uniref:Uncharacterized protein n=1 Tax=Diversispora epigaea TaxID=1348612 RepID=A0A397IAP0_9GLOM|nr:hypothetical protein Glove_271g3 [Diversispora epigaea]
MEQDQEVMASSSGTTQEGEQFTGKKDIEITPSVEATSERSIIPSNEETTITKQKNPREKEATMKTKEMEKEIRKDKGKEKEMNTLETEEQTTETDIDNEDTISISFNEMNLSENEKWRIETNAK